jgi:hypothetical protein
MRYSESKELSYSKTKVIYAYEVQVADSVFFSTITFVFTTLIRQSK